MTSTAADAVATVLCTAKQTRFHIEAPNYRELDVEGLSISVVAAGGSTAKARARAPAVEILAGATLRLKQGRRYALVGRNGTGKSTLLRAIADKLIPGIPEETRVAILQQTGRTDGDGDGSTAGRGCSGPSVLQHVINRATARDTVEREIKVLAQGVGAADALSPVRALRRLKHERLQKRLFRLDKDARLRSGARGLQARKTLVAFEKVVAASDAGLRQADDGHVAADALRAETQEAADMLADLELQVEPSRLAHVETRAKSILAGLGFSPDRMARPAASMSGGWHMRASLAAVLLHEADILVLDEPTNFLDLLGILWLQRHLRALDTTMVLVSHDRDFVGLCTDLLVLRDRQITAFHGDLATFEASQAERKLWLAKMRDAQAKQRSHVERTIQQNMRAGKANDDLNKIRQAKSRQKKLDNRWGLEVSARGGRFKLNRDLVGYHASAREDIDVPPEERPVVITLPEPADLRFPGALLALDKASYRYDARAPPVVRDVDLGVAMGDRVGIVGLNGAGKSTLIKLLVDEARPTGGSVTAHPRLRMGYYAQHAVDALQARGRAEPELTALALLTRDVDGQLDEGEVRGLLGALGLPGRLASAVPVSRLSGGQLVRCELARLLWRRPQCLVLDEPTTHLDYETVTALRVALARWAGAVVLVSHDRWFMRGAVEGNLGDDGGGDDDDDDDDGSDGAAGDAATLSRRRVVYQLKGGAMAALDGGVDEFEALMEKRVSRLVESARAS